MVDNHDPILVNAILDHYEQPPDIISLIHAFGKITLTRQRQIKIREVSSQKALQIYHQLLLLKLLSDLKESLMKGKIRIIYRN